jgi:hypothetical protein
LTKDAALVPFEFRFHRADEEIGMEIPTLPRLAQEIDIPMSIPPRNHPPSKDLPVREPKPAHSGTGGTLSCFEIRKEEQP